MLRRKKIFALLVCVLSLSNATFATTVPSEKEVQQIISAALQDKTGYKLIESLTTEVGPRLGGTEHEHRARLWAQAQFKTLNFDKVKIDEFPLKAWHREHESARIISPYPQALTITALGGSPSTPKGGVSGKVTRFASLAALQAQKDDSLRGRIVFIDEIMVRTQDGAGYGAAVQKRRETAFEAARVGAVAALIRSVGTSHHRFAHTGMMKSLNGESLPKSVPTAALSSPDADQLQRILKSGKELTLEIDIKVRFEAKATSGNVIAELIGKSKPEEIVLVGAHLDSWDLGTGAVDDGAGVGIVMAAAALVKRVLKRQPERTIRVVLFGSEEIGLIGAFDYAKRYESEVSRHIAAAESDFGARRVIKVGSVNVNDEKFELVQQLQKQLVPLQVLLGNNKAYGGPDLYPLKKQGVPLISLTQDGLDYFDLHHTPNDTFDKIELSEIQQNIAAYAIFLYTVAYSDIDFR